MKSLVLLLLLIPAILCAGTIKATAVFDETSIRGAITAPGRAMEPVQQVNILLPAGSTVLSHTVQLSAPVSAGKQYNTINPALSDGISVISPSTRSGQKPIYQYLGQRKWGDVTYAAFTFSPSDPLSGMWYPQADIAVEYSVSKAAQKRIPPTFQLPDFFINQDMLSDWYISSPTRDIRYLVVSTPALYASMTNWESYWESKGFIVQFFDIANILQTSPGANDAEKLRNFLVAEYTLNAFTYLLLVGDYDTVPVAYLCPEPDGFDTIPSDFYYSDLSSTWDSDNDNRLGEYYSVAGVQDYQVDYTPEVFVGRISSNNPAEVLAIGNRIVAFDSSTAAFKQKALLPAAFLNYQDEPELGMPVTDGAGFMELAKDTVLRDYQNTTLYEQIGAVVSYPSVLPLSSTHFNEQLRNVEFGLINWSAHGSSVSSSRKIWVSDDNVNGIPDSWEMQWMGLVNKNSFDNITTNTGSVIFAASCYNGMIDNDEESLAEYALIKKGIGVIGATRTGWYKLGWQNPGWGGLSSYNYHFLENYAEHHHSLGAAHAYTNLLHTQYYLFGDPIDTGGIIWPELQNVYTYMLYGDPAVGHNFVNPPQGEILVFEPDSTDGLRVVNSLREIEDYNVIYSNRLITDYDYINSFEAVICLLGDHELSASEYDILNGYLNEGGKMYLEGNVAWNDTDPFWGKFATSAPFDMVLHIENISHQDFQWLYNEQQEYYQALMPTATSAEVIFSTNNANYSDGNVGILNVTDTYRTIGSSFLLSEVLDNQPDSFSDLISLIMYHLDLTDNMPVTNEDQVLPVVVQKLTSYPNPMASEIKIALENPTKNSFEVKVYNLKGQIVDSLVLDAKNGYSTVWNGKDKSGRACPNGVYLVKCGELIGKISLIRN